MNRLALMLIFSALAFGQAKDSAQKPAPPTNRELGEAMCFVQQAVASLQGSQTNGDSPYAYWADVATQLQIRFVDASAKQDGEGLKIKAVRDWAAQFRASGKSCPNGWLTFFEEKKPPALAADAKKKK